MALIFDTATVPAKDRPDGLRVALAETSVSAVELLAPRNPVSARLDVWTLGDCYLFRAETSPVRMFRTARQARQEPAPLLALAVQERGDGWHHQFASTRQIRAGTLMGMDMTEPFDFSWTGDGASRALMVPLEHLDVSADLLRCALPRLPLSPLYGLVTSHVVELFEASDAVSSTPLSSEIATASTDLARALVTSLSDDRSARRAAAAQTLLARIREHIRQHLRDPDLSATSIAAAQNISLRQLYNVCSAADVSLEQLIIRRRLHGIHAELTLPAAEQRTIESVARGWGFRNVTHFTRRFTEEFGMRPGEWRHEAASARRHRRLGGPSNHSAPSDSPLAPAGAADPAGAGQQQTDLLRSPT